MANAMTRRKHVLGLVVPAEGEEFIMAGKWKQQQRGAHILSFLRKQRVNWK